VLTSFQNSFEEFATILSQHVDSSIGTLQKGTLQKGTLQKGTLQKGTLQKGTLQNPLAFFAGGVSPWLF
jgi:hypothetical protein